MNIAATMAVLDVWDLDRTAKHALLVVCCRCNHATATARVSVGRVAADMKVHYTTAAAALRRAVDGGYLSVENLPGMAPMWTVSDLSTSRVDRGYLAGLDREGVAGLDRDEGVFRERQGTAGAHEQRPQLNPADPAAIAACEFCDECGYRWRTDGVVRCSHQLVAGYTDQVIADALGSRR